MDSQDPKISYWWLLALIAGVISIWAFSGWYLFGDAEKRGTFGDMFGAVNALFSGLAFASIFFTILVQRQELELQRRDLKTTKAHLESQNEVMRDQNFEATFFQLLRALGEIVAGLDFRDFTPPAVGRNCFNTMTKSLHSHYDSSLRNFSGEEELIRMSYRQVYGTFQGAVGHYFRTLYNLVKYVHESHVSNKRLYTNLIRSQLSSPELLILFYNCLTEYGEKKFKPLVEKYALLKSLPVGQLLNPKHVDFYKQSAFGTSPDRPDSR